MANNPKRPSLKQKAFAKKYIEYKGNGAKAALEVYDTTKEYAKNVAYITLQKEGTKRAIEEIMNKNQLDLDTLTEYGSEAIQNNLTLGKPSQAVGADLLKFYYKLHNVIPKEGKGIIKQERKILLDKDYNVLREELSTTITRSQDLLQDL